MVVVSVRVLVSELMENLVSGCINLVLKGLLFTSWFVFENRSVGQKEKLTQTTLKHRFLFFYFIWEELQLFYCK